MKIMYWLFLVLLGLIILSFTHIFYFNFFTNSLPNGIYMRINGTPQRGSYASSCLTQEVARYGIVRGYLAQGTCGTGTVRVLKIIKGLPGDHFAMKNGFLELNGNFYSIMNKDSSGRTLRTFYRQNEGILGKDQYILISNFVKNSWDSRYWGPVTIEFLLKPLWILENVKR
jgi:conjugative transfer signal peptidase TraF